MNKIPSLLRQPEPEIHELPTDLQTFSSGDDAWDAALKAKAPQIAEIYGADVNEPLRVFRAQANGLALVVLCFTDGNGLPLALMLTAADLKVYSPSNARR